jgi:hypothetical protein
MQRYYAVVEATSNDEANQALLTIFKKSYFTIFNIIKPPYYFYSSLLLKFSNDRAFPSDAVYCQKHIYFGNVIYKCFI